MCEKGKKTSSLLKAMRGKKSVLLGGNLWTLNGKDSILWSLLAKYGLLVAKNFTILQIL